MIEQREGGIWYMRITVKGQPRVQKSTKTTDRALAQQIHDKLEAEMILGLHGMTKTKAPTLREAFDAALRSHYARTKNLPAVKASFAVVAGIITEDILLSDITEDTYTDIVDAMYKENYAPATINRKLALLSKLMRLNAAKLSRLPKVPLQKEYAGRKRYLTDAEEVSLFEAVVERILKHEGNPKWVRFNALVAFLIDSGVRLSEALGITPDAIDHEAKAVHLWATKSGSPRTVPLTDRAYEALASVDWRFDLTVHSSEHMWRTIAADMGLADEEGFVLHCLRHTCCTRLIKRGEDLALVQKWMGHKTIQTTLIYSHLDTGDLLACRDSLQKAQGMLPGRSTKILPKTAHEAAASVEANAERAKGSEGEKCNELRGLTESIHGARNRNRTGTPSLARDFKSLKS